MIDSVTVFGGSGFVGRDIVRRLASDGADVRIAVRHPGRANFLKDVSNRITLIAADVWQERSVGPAIHGADAVVNTVGHYVERGRATFEAVHGQGALHVARACAEAGIRRLVHISGLGADLPSPSAYVRARAKGERLVSDTLQSATILRPSVIFGPDDAFLTRLTDLTASLPVLPLFGRGETRLQPVYVGDVAEAVARALATSGAQGKIYELGGPRVYTYKELIRLVLQHTGRKRLLLRVPFGVWDTLASALSLLPNPPLSRDQVTLMKIDNVVAAGALTLDDLGVRPTLLESFIKR